LPVAPRKFALARRASGDSSFGAHLLWPHGHLRDSRVALAMEEAAQREHAMKQMNRLQHLTAALL
jgi:hypothetical protein